MEILKKIWYWFFNKKEVETYEDIKAKALKDVPIEYNTGSYTKNVERYVAPSYSKTISSSNNTYRNNNDNFLMGVMAGYAFVDSLNDNTPHKTFEETKSSNYESSYVPSSSSSYSGGSYSSSYDSGSSSSCSCNSGC